MSVPCYAFVCLTGLADTLTDRDPDAMMRECVGVTVFALLHWSEWYETSLYFTDDQILLNVSQIC